MTRALGLVGLALLLSGCVGMGTLVDALAKDPASACLSVQTIYGSVAVARTNTPGTKVTIAGGQCTVESPK